MHRRQQGERIEDKGADEAEETAHIEEKKWARETHTNRHIQAGRRGEKERRGENGTDESEGHAKKDRACTVDEAESIITLPHVS